ncbi:putative transcription factor bHLH family [Helianthus annuus]|uniref:Putative myc-type, basic helix-loop-helix (BHLH) domain-containing protein n=1 Tax=Helianthus annuus TaxID=4232 RepID=A0A251UBF5_HELAN|nr:transcription factor bHLH18 [Helianthus annuus]XP_021972901.1 transcription factor bHLH18 [Helianthus annuus]XP_021972902.1 transcription factor bHLH18 [Helianthus annuus]XP_021972903.1 transcription factor bHLH18 [Helianthus annuus]XP_035831550.1 transcription factor bHLH18 [Helianthus annuus]XP_035831551.1 transcription factor bHLH18 [Helianthus annuus]KAF5798767.1 putative transcription factor bHLH family [Helianthus annuus]KAJ0550329.1 putative transcription factor bHLH family [Helian
MDIPYGTWFPELNSEDLHQFLNQHQQTHPYSEFVDSSSSPSFDGYQNLVTKDQTINAAIISRDLEKQDYYKANTTSSFAPIGRSPSSTFTISFGDSASQATINQNQLYGGYTLKFHDAIKRKDEMSLNELLGTIEVPKRVSSTRRNHRQAQEHILAERKRREKLTQRFISLAALLPEVKKMDKATVLEDASKYIIDLQNRVKELEETSIIGKTVIQESTTSSMSKSKSQGGHELEVASFDPETNSSPSNAAFNPGIKVRILGSNVLVRIYCHGNQSLALKALTEMERLHFTVMCNSVLPISATAALITIIAQMSEDLAVTARDLLKCLRLSLSNF